MSQVQKGLKSLDSAMAHSAGDLEDRIKMEEVMEGHYIVYGFGNVGVIFTSEGIVVIDTSTSK